MKSTTATPLRKEPLPSLVDRVKQEGRDHATLFVHHESGCRFGSEMSIPPEQHDVLQDQPLPSFQDNAGHMPLEKKVAQEAQPRLPLQQDRKQSDTRLLGHEHYLGQGANQGGCPGCGARPQHLAHDPTTSYAAHLEQRENSTSSAHYLTDFSRTAGAAMPDLPYTSSSVDRNKEGIMTAGEIGSEYHLGQSRRQTRSKYV